MCPGGWHLEPHMLQNMIVDDYLCELQLWLQVVINGYKSLGISPISGYKWFAVGGISPIST